MYSLAEKNFSETSNNKKAVPKTVVKSRILEFIVCGFYENIYHECLKFMDDEDEVPDQVNEILIKCYENLSKYDSGKSMLSTWVMNITRNYLADFKKMTQHMPEIICFESDFFDRYSKPCGNEYQAESKSKKDKAEAACIKRALKRMRNKPRLTLMYRAEDISYREIAYMLNISEKAAMEVHRRAIKRFKKLFLEEMCESDEE